jgi:signal transduction histidine kinase
MKTKQANFFRKYRAALRQHLEKRGECDSGHSHKLGREAMAAGLQTLDLARFHEEAVLQLVAPSFSSMNRAKMVKRAGKFFAELIKPIELTHRVAREANVFLSRINDALSERTLELATSNLELKKEILQRKEVEKALRTSERHYSVLLEQSRDMQDQLRLLSHQVLSAQEDERKKISRELHDEIAQTLAGINVRLGALKAESGVHGQGFQAKIDHTQRLVEKSVDIVHRFARELRPTLLDDLGLIPALHAFVKTFTEETGIRVRLTVFAGVEELDNARRTVLYRVAQEALTNVVRHAHAPNVIINIQKLAENACMTITDNGKCPKMDPMLKAKRGKRLGLIGMRERLEMVGGSFHIQSVEGKGTTVRAEVPMDNGNGKIDRRSRGSITPRK